jgi:hypothetical protein
MRPNTKKTKSENGYVSVCEVYNVDYAQVYSYVFSDPMCVHSGIYISGMGKYLNHIYMQDKYARTAYEHIPTHVYI